MGSWGAGSILALVILLFGFYFNLLWPSIILAIVIMFAMGLSRGRPTDIAGAAAPVPVAPVQAAPPPQQVIVVKETIKTEPRMAGWKPAWNRSPIPISIIKDPYMFDPLWKKAIRGISRQVGKGMRGLKERVE